MLRPLVPAITVNGWLSEMAQLENKRLPGVAVAGASIRADSVLPMPTVPFSATFPAGPEQFVVAKAVAVSSATVSPGLTFSLKLPSVNELVATPDSSPVARIWYVATNQSGRLNESVTTP